MTDVKIADEFAVVTTRPLNALHKVGIAELAQFTHFPADRVFAIANAELAVRKEWNWEIDADHDLNQLTLKNARVVFRDGSTLSFAAKKKQ
jgi:hypothetical protein